MTLDVELSIIGLEVKNGLDLRDVRNVIGTVHTRWRDAKLATNRPQ